MEPNVFKECSILFKGSCEQKGTGLESGMYKRGPRQHCRPSLPKWIWHIARLALRSNKSDKWCDDSLAGTFSPQFMQMIANVSIWDLLTYWLDSADLVSACVKLSSADILTMVSRPGQRWNTTSLTLASRSMTSLLAIRSNFLASYIRLSHVLLLIASSGSGKT